MRKHFNIYYRCARFLVLKIDTFRQSAKIRYQFPQGQDMPLNRIILITSTILFTGKTTSGFSETEESHTIRDDRYIQDFTADILEPGELKLGLQSAVGVGLDTHIGFDLVSLGVGVPNLSVKTNVWQNQSHSVTLGLAAAYLDQHTALWGSAESLFDELSLRVYRPQVNWTHKVSKRLFLHTFWSAGVGPIAVELSEKGKRRLWESKYPGGDYDTRSQNREEIETNIDRNNTVAQRSLQVQSLVGLSRDVFQVSGELIRDRSKKVILTTRIDRTEFADLSSRGLRLTAAQEWRVNSFNIRIGFGINYSVISGTDLDDEKIDDSGVTPIADLDFYWII